MLDADSMQHVLRLLGLALALFAGAAQAQTLRGTVTDAVSGAPLPGATVTVAGLDRGAATGADGRFELAGLPARALEITVTFVGFAPATRAADLSRGDAALDVALVPAEQNLDEVRVEADAAREALTRDVRAVARLDAADLEETRGQTLAESLERIPGVTTLSTGPSIAKPVVRGLHSERLVVLNNGVPQEGQQWGGEHAPEIDPFAPAEIEVVKGAAGVEYGAGAIGGVIRIEERALPETPGVAGRASLNAFSNSGQGAASAYLEGASAVVPGFAWRAQGSFRRAGDARTPDFVVRNSAFREASGQLALGYRTGALALEGHLRRFDTELGIYRGSHFGNARNLEAIIARGGPDPDWDYRFSYRIEAPKQTVTHDVGQLGAALALPRGDRLEVRYGLQRNVRQEYDSHRPYNDSLEALGQRPAFDLTLVTNTLDARLHHAPRAGGLLGRVFGVVGLSGMNQANENGASGYLIPDFRALSGGAFAHETWAATDRLSLDAGLRLDYRWMRAFPYHRARRQFDRRIHAYASASAALGALYQLGPAWSVAVNAGSAWRPPGVNELYSDGVHHGTARFERGNSALEAERSLDLSATLRHESARVSAEASAYANHIGGFIYALEAPAPSVTIRGTFPAFDYTQDDVRLAGLDADLTVRPSGWLDLGASVSVLRADNLSRGGPLYAMPADRARLRARLHTDRLGRFGQPYVEAEGSFVRQQDRLQPGAYEPAAPPPGYALAGLRLGAELLVSGQPLTVSVGVENLLGVRYRDYLSRFRYFIDEPGRNVVLRVSMPFGRPGA